MSTGTLTPNGTPVALTFSSDKPITYSTISGTDEVAVAYQSGPAFEVAGYNLAGDQLFADTGPGGGGFTSILDFSLASVGGFGLLMAWDTESLIAGGSSFTGSYQFIDAAGHELSRVSQASAYFPFTAFSAPDGVHLEWNATGPDNPNNGLPSSYIFTAQDISSGGIASQATTGSSGYGPQAILPYANTVVGSLGDLVISDNQAQLAGQAAVTFPGEPAHAVTDVAAAGLADGTTAAVAWVDSGTDYVSILNGSTNSFGPQIGLDWGGASDLHVVALPDGGFAVSWENGGAYKGEVFDAAGSGGGIISLAGDIAGIDSHGDLYTVGLNSGGSAEVIQTYAINGGGGGGGGTAGQTFTSDNAGDHWLGTAGNDTFNLGRGGDVVTGNGGDDTYKFAEIPWAGGHITDFSVGDVLNLTGLMSTTADSGPNGFADGYLRLVNDPQGEAQVWARYATSDFATWWLVTTLDGVASSSLQTSGDVITVSSGSGGAVTTSSADYVAPANVTAITLTGSQQYIDASATTGVTITSDNTGNTLIGGSGDDVFHLGRGGDITTGGAGADTFAFAETPWNAGLITDFNGSQGDQIDVSGLLARSGYAGSDPFADGYLKYTTDAQDDAQLWSDVNQPGNTGWWLVATLDGVSTSSLHYANGLIT